jgi:hypothetical protein
VISWFQILLSKFNLYRYNEAWRAKLSAKTSSASAAAAAGPSSADYRLKWGKAMAMADGGEELSYNDIPWPLSERDEKGINVAAGLYKLNPAHPYLETAWFQLFHL